MELLLCKINVPDIFHIVDYLKSLLILRSTKVPIKSKFWLRMYVRISLRRCEIMNMWAVDVFAPRVTDFSDKIFSVAHWYWGLHKILKIQRIIAQWIFSLPKNLVWCSISKRDIFNVVALFPGRLVTDNVLSCSIQYVSKFATSILTVVTTARLGTLGVRYFCSY